MSGLARNISLFTAAEIKTLLRTSRRALYTPGMIVKIAPSTASFGRILVVASAKSGTAPQRNTFKRRCKSIFYQEKLYEKLRDCVVIVRKEGIATPYDILKELLTAVLNQPLR